MDELRRALIEKAGHDFGFEHVVERTPDSVTMASALHGLNAKVIMEGTGHKILFQHASATLFAELNRDFSVSQSGYIVPDTTVLTMLLKRASSLAYSLPNQAQTDFETEVIQILDQLPTSVKGTEVERMVRQRIGQQTFRNAMMHYWGNACAITGISIPALLRASHAKPWAECGSDAERLDVFNGFLLSANLDALFDRFLISVDETGAVLISNNLSISDRDSLGLLEPLQVRWLAPEHGAYLAFHRSRFFSLLGEPL